MSARDAISELEEPAGKIQKVGDEHPQLGRDLSGAAVPDGEWRQAHQETQRSLANTASIMADLAIAVKGRLSNMASMLQAALAERQQQSGTAAEAATQAASAAAEAVAKAAVVAQHAASAPPAPRSSAIAGLPSSTVAWYWNLPATRGPARRNASALARGRLLQRMIYATARTPPGGALR